MMTSGLVDVTLSGKAVIFKRIDTNEVIIQEPSEVVRWKIRSCAAESDKRTD